MMLLKNKIITITTNGFFQSCFALISPQGLMLPLLSLTRRVAPAETNNPVNLFIYPLLEINDNKSDSFKKSFYYKSL